MSKRRFALYGEASRSALTFEGKVLVHDSREDLEFLFPGVRVVELGSMIPPEDTMWVGHHPSLEQVRWPLERGDFAQYEREPPPSGPTRLVKQGALSTWTNRIE